MIWPSLTIILNLLLISPLLSIASPHLPDPLDRSRIRSVHRRHHARRKVVELGCQNAASGNNGKTNPVIDPSAESNMRIRDEYVSELSNLTLLEEVVDFTLGLGSELVTRQDEDEDADTDVTGAAVSAADSVAEVVVVVIDEVIPAVLGVKEQGTSPQRPSTGPSLPTAVPSQSSPYSIEPTANPFPPVSAAVAQQSTKSSPSDDSGSGSASSELDNQVLAANDPASGNSACNHGDWGCSGMNLQRCNWGAWVFIKTCTGDNIVCSSSGAAIGCVWSWSVQPASQPNPTPSPPASSKASTASAGTTGTVKVGGTTAPVATTSSAATVSPSSSPSQGSGDNEDCEEWEEDVSSTHSVDSTTSKSATMPLASSTASPQASASPTQSAIGDDDEDCEEWEEESSSSSHSTTQSASTTPTSSMSTTVSGTTNKAAAGTTSYTSKTATVTASPGLTDNAVLIGNPATLSANGSILSTLTQTSKSLVTIDPSTITISSITTTSTATQGVVTGSPDAVATYSAPHYVIYSDYWLFSMPTVESLKSFNRFILAFWMSNSGPVDNAQMWTWMSQSDRRKTLDAYHKAGIALMVSAFGSTDQPTTWGKDPLQVAQDLAKFVIAYEFDGVDIDYEDMGAMNSDKGEAWLIPFQRELRRLLPKPYLISHAPVAPWFTSANVYRSGAYVSIHQQTGDGIDFYNMQFYNQGWGVYTDCTSLITQSGGYWPGTSVMEMNAYAKVPLNKIVIGKPLDAGKADNGYMDPASLNTCVKLARTKGWNGGVMFWEWTTDAPGIMATSRA